VDKVRSASERVRSCVLHDHNAANLSIEPDDFEYAPFSQQGGLGKVHQLFSDKLGVILDDLNQKLVA